MDEIAVGKIGAPRGLKGYVRVLSFSGETKHFSSFDSVYLRNGERSVVKKVEGIQRQAGKAFIKFAGLDDPESAGEFTDWEIWVPRKKGAKRRRGEYYISDLSGCGLFFEGKCVGTVLHVSDIGYVALLEVEKIDGSKAYVPLIERYVGRIDTKSRSIELENDWILD